MADPSSRRPSRARRPTPWPLLLLAACGGGAAGPAPTVPSLTIADSSVAEGDAGTTLMPFTVSLSQAMAGDLTVGYSSNVVTADGLDFSVERGTVTIPAGATQATIEIAVYGDTAYETDETLTVTLEDVPPSVRAVSAQAFGTIRTDDLPTVAFAPAAEQVVEGDDRPVVMVFRVELAGITNQLSVDFATSDLTAVAGADYAPTSGTLTIPAGATSATVEVEILGDTDPESLEELRVTLSNLAGDAVLHPAAFQAVGRILDNDTPVVVVPSVGSGLTLGLEGDAGTTEMAFPVVLSTPVATDVVLDYSTRDVGSALAGVDYDATSGRVRIVAGQTSAAIPVQVRGDTEIEGMEHFELSLTLVSGSVVLDTPRVRGGILDDDWVGPPLLVAFGAATFEGDSGVKDLVFNVVLEHPAAGQVTIDYATGDGTALSGSDYDAVSGTLTFPPGEVLRTVRVPVHGDTVVEASESLHLTLSNLTGPATLLESLVDGVIETDDPLALVSIDDVAQLEGDAGARDMVFTVVLSAVAGDPVTFDFASADGTATAGQDYGAVAGSVSIPAGQTRATITVPINGDTDSEFDEGFTIVLSNVSQNAELRKATGTGGIVNDDQTPGWGVPQALPQDGQDNVLPQVRMNAAGEVVAAWAPRSSGLYEAVRSTPATGWGPLEQPSPRVTAGAVSDKRELFLDGAGRATLAYVFGVAQVVQRAPGSGWGAVLEWDPASYRNQDYLRLAGNRAGAVMAIWKENTPVTITDHLRFSVYDPALDAWSASDYLVFEGQRLEMPAVAMNARGDAVAVWWEGSVRASRYDAATGGWSTPLPISRELSPGFFAPGYLPQVAMDDDGNAMAVWDDGGSIGTSVRGNVWAARYVAATDRWVEPFQVELGALDATHAQVAMDAVGNSFVVWLQDNLATDPWNDSFEIRARRHDAASDTWGPEVLVHDADLRVSQFGFDVHLPLDVPALAVDAAGNAILAWSERVEGNLVIRSSRYDAGAASPGWGPPERISGDTHPFAIFPDVAVDLAGIAVAVWQEGDSEFFTSSDVSEIWSNRYLR